MCGEKLCDVPGEGLAECRLGGDDQQVIVIGEEPEWGGMVFRTSEGRCPLVDEVE